MTTQTYKHMCSHEDLVIAYSNIKQPKQPIVIVGHKDVNATFDGCMTNFMIYSMENAKVRLIGCNVDTLYVYGKMSITLALDQSRIGKLVVHGVGGDATIYLQNRSTIRSMQATDLKFVNSHIDECEIPQAFTEFEDPKVNLAMRFTEKTIFRKQNSFLAKNLVLSSFKNPSSEIIVLDDSVLLLDHCSFSTLRAKNPTAIYAVYGSHVTDICLHGDAGGIMQLDTSSIGKISGCGSTASKVTDFVDVKEVARHNVEFPPGSIEVISGRGRSVKA